MGAGQVVRGVGQSGGGRRKGRKTRLDPATNNFWEHIDRWWDGADMSRRSLKSAISCRGKEAGPMDFLRQ